MKVGISDNYSPQAVRKKRPSERTPTAPEKCVRTMLRSGDFVSPIYLGNRDRLGQLDHDVVNWVNE